MSKTKMIKMKNKILAHDKANYIKNLMNDTRYKYADEIESMSVGIVSAFNMYERTYELLWLDLAKKFFKDQKRLEKLGKVPAVPTRARTKEEIK